MSTAQFNQSYSNAYRVYVVTSTGWEGLSSASLVPNLIPRVACPLCGEPLDNKDGVTHCPFDGWIGEEGDTA